MQLGRTRITILSMARGKTEGASSQATERGRQAAAGSPSPGPESQPSQRMRMDRWLWVARFFKTRSAASQACAAGHVKLNGTSAKAAKTVRPGDRIQVTYHGGRLRIAEVKACATRRGPAPEARALYEDHSPPPPPREETFVRRDRGAGRPAKRERRMLNRVRGR